jgi:hypothetical protein
MKPDTIVYVYFLEKENKYKVLNHFKAQRMHDLWIKAGYVHIYTLDAVNWIQNKLNENRKRKTTETP